MSLETKFVRKFTQSCEKVARWMPDKYVVIVKPNNSGVILKRKLSADQHQGSFSSAEGMKDIDLAPEFSIEIEVFVDPESGEFKIMSSQDDVDVVLHDLGFEYEVEKVVSDPSGIKRRNTWRVTYWSLDEGPNNDWINTFDPASPIKVLAALWALIEVVNYESKHRIIKMTGKMVGLN